MGNRPNPPYGHPGDADPSQEQNYPSQLNARTRVVEILTRIDTRQAYTDKILDKELDGFNDADRGLMTEVVNGVMRWQYRLDWYLRQLYVGEYGNLIPDVKNNLRSSAYQLMYLDKVPAYAVLNEAVEIAKSKYNQKTANLVNAILRNFLRQMKKLEYLEMQLPFRERLSVKYSHPAWMVERWIDQWGIDDTVALCESNNRRPAVNVRINSLRADRETLFRTLDERGIGYTVHPDFPEYLRLDDFSQFRKLDYLDNGWVVVQDVSTGIPVRLLEPRPGENILDMCAAPGGKSSFIAERMANEGQLLALEKQPGRAEILRDNMARFGVTIADIQTEDANELILERRFDKILLDAPCTGLGVLAKRVDLRWKRTLQDIETMQQQQLALLDSATGLLAPGGVLVYSTCTIEPDENERVVERFLEKHPEYALDTLLDIVPRTYLWDKHHVRTFPQRHDMDGSFAVRLRHRGE